MRKLFGLFLVVWMITSSAFAQTEKIYLGKHLFQTPDGTYIYVSEYESKDGSSHTDLFVGTGEKAKKIETKGGVMAMCGDGQVIFTAEGALSWSLGNSRCADNSATWKDAKIQVLIALVGSNQTQYHAPSPFTITEYGEWVTIEKK